MNTLTPSMHEKKQTILAFIKQQKLAVISTINKDNKPNSAVVEFGETDVLELVFDTLSSSRKYQNLKNNASVSCVIGWDENITVQYEGIAEELIGEESEAYKQAYWSKNPEAKRWATREGITYFKVTPTWIRYSDLNTAPWEVFEI
jgi:general stress protein 26